MPYSSPIVAKLPSKKVSPFKLKTKKRKKSQSKNNKKRIKRDNISMAARFARRQIHGSGASRRFHVFGSIDVVSFDSFFYCLFDCLFHCGADFFRRELCHNGTCVAWEPGARAPGPGGLWGWKPPREY